MAKIKHIIYDNYNIYSDEMKEYAKETFKLNEVTDYSEEVKGQN